MTTISIITTNTITVVITTAHKWAPKAPGWGWWGPHSGPSTSRCDKAVSVASASQISAQILQKSGGFEQNCPFIYPNLAVQGLYGAELKGQGDTWALQSREHPSCKAPLVAMGRTTALPDVNSPALGASGHQNPAGASLGRAPSLLPSWGRKRRERQEML